MKYSLQIFTIAVFAAAAVFSGCTKKAVKTDVEVDMAKQEAPAAPAPEPVPAAPQVEITPAEEVSPAPVMLTSVYFDFDRYEIRSDAAAALRNNARLLADEPERRVMVEGHCDERGTDEYNIALGEKRAMAVKKYLSDLGVSPGRISVISYGSEKPACFGHNEQCWQANRRAQFRTP